MVVGSGGTNGQETCVEQMIEAETRREAEEEVLRSRHRVEDVEERRGRERLQDGRWEQRGEVEGEVRLQLRLEQRPVRLAYSLLFSSSRPRPTEIDSAP